MQISHVESFIEKDWFYLTSVKLDESRLTREMGQLVSWL
jgi:hypothetical protein